MKVKTVYPARKCQNFNHWAIYIKETINKIKLNKEVKQKIKQFIILI